MRILIISLFLVKLVLSDIEFGICFANRGGFGLHKLIQDCPFAIILLANGVAPEVSGFKGLYAVVCCPESYEDIPWSFIRNFDGSIKVNIEDTYGKRSKQENFGTCHLSDGSLGLYKNIQKCPYAKTLVTRGVDPVVHGFDGFDVVVCCPNPLNDLNFPYDPSVQYIPYTPKVINIPDYPDVRVPDNKDVYKADVPYVTSVPNIPKDKNDNGSLDTYRKDVVDITNVKNVPDIPNSPKYRDNVDNASDHSRIKDAPDVADNKNVKDTDAYRPPFPRIPNVPNIPNGSIDTNSEDVKVKSPSQIPYILNGSSARNVPNGQGYKGDVDSYTPSVLRRPNDSNSPNNIRDDEDKTNLGILYVSNILNVKNVPNISNIPKDRDNTDPHRPIVPHVPNVRNASDHTRIKDVPDASDNKNVKDIDAYRPPYPRIPNVPNIPSAPNGPIDTNKKNDKDNSPSHRPYISNGSSAPNVSNGPNSPDKDVPGDKNDEDDTAVPNVLDPTDVSLEANATKKLEENNKQGNGGDKNGGNNYFRKLIAQWEGEKNGNKARDKPGDLSAAQCIDYYSYYEAFVSNGNRSLPKEFPHMAVIGYDTDDSISWGCGGALISENFILTAAHCLYSRSSGSAKHVRLGDLDLESTTDDALPQQFRVKRTIAHPDYNPPFKYHDIGLIELDSKVNRTNYVNIACLDITRQNGSINLTTIGFGKTDFASQQSSFLMKADLMVYPHDTCQKSYKNDSDTLNNGIDDEIMICAGGYSDTCQDDSGGPLFYKNENIRKSVPVYNIVGVTSFGKACGVSRIPGVYTRVHKYLRWIEDIVWPK